MTTMVHVADIVLVRNDRVLLVQQEKIVAYGQWGLPGGKLEAGETPDQALLRELQEELGITLDPKTLMGSLAHSGGAPDEQHLQVTTYFASSPQLVFGVQKGELMGFGWFTLGELKNLGADLRSSWIIDMAKHALKEVV
jgi:mutator protein MutT